MNPGKIFGPILFNIYISIIGVQLNNCTHHLHADNTNICASELSAKKGTARFSFPTNLL